MKQVLLSQAYLKMGNQLLKLPGMVDVHVHLREPGGMQKEDFETGTMAAIAGGYTQILDMPNNIPPTVDLMSLEDKISRAKGRIWCDLGFNFGATAESVKYFKQVYKKAFGLKVYMNQTTGPLLVDKSEDRELIFKSWISNIPIMVHAQDETIEDAIRLAKKYRKKIHICHMTANQIRSINKAKTSGINVTTEVCPHHLFLNKGDIQSLGPLGIMKPPLMSKADQHKLWDNLELIDMISTDHAPHTLEEKYDKRDPKFGVPGLETTLPLMFTAVTRKLIGIEKLVEKLATNPRKIFNLPKQDKTFVIYDTTRRYKLSEKKLFTKCRWTPFKDLEGKGEVKEVVIRGETVFKDGKYVGRPSGRVMQQNAK